MGCGYSAVMTRIQQNGVPRENLAVLDLPIIGVKIIAPMLVVKQMLRDKILDIYRVTYFCQLIFCFFGAGIVYLSASGIGKEDPKRSVGLNYPQWYLGIILVYQSLNYALLAAWGSCSTGGFINRVVDQRIAGSYITLIMCFNNFGWRITSTVVLYLIDVLSFYGCVEKFDQVNGNYTFTNGTIVENYALENGTLVGNYSFNGFDREWNDADLKG